MWRKSTNPIECYRIRIIIWIECVNDDDDDDDFISWNIYTHLYYNKHNDNDDNIFTII